MLGLGNSVTRSGVLSEEPPFILSTNSDLKVWLQFNTGITFATPPFVTQWDDSSGNNNHAINTKAGSQPTSADGRLIFAGSQTMLLPVRNDASFTAIIALDLDETVTLTNEVLIGNSNAAWGIKLYRAGGADDVGLRINGNTASPSPPTSGTAHVDRPLLTGNLPSGKFLFTTSYNGTNGEVNFRVNGALAAFGTFGGSTFNSFRLEQMGSGAVGSGQVNGDIYELAYYDVVLGGQDLFNAEQAIIDRVGISI